MACSSSDGLLFLRPQLDALATQIRPDRQTLLFSATFPTPLLKLARDYTRDPVEVATVSGPTAETMARRSTTRPL